MKNDQYWTDLHSIAEEVTHLSNTIQGPLMDKHADDLVGKSVDEITAYLEQFYDDDTRKAWKQLDSRGAELTAKYGVDPIEVQHDLWTLMGKLPHSDKEHALH